MVFKLASSVELGSKTFLIHSYEWEAFLQGKDYREYWLGSSWWHDSTFNNLQALSFDIIIHYNSQASWDLGSEKFLIHSYEWEAFLQSD